MEKSKKDIYEVITSKIIELLKDHKEQNFSKNWFEIPGLIPKNVISQKTYTGINPLLLEISRRKNDFKLSSWLTFKQVVKLGGKVIKGSKSTQIAYASFLYFDEDGKNITKKINALKKKGLNVLELMNFYAESRPYLKLYNVFNVEQTTDLDPKYYINVSLKVLENLTDIEIYSNAENVLISTNAKINFEAQNNAFYSHLTDSITLPLRKQFKSSGDFYGVAFHELGHWTGHSSRLDRKKGGKFGSKSYAFEELIAEINAAFVCASLGIDFKITDNVDYINSWLKVLENDNKFVVHASSKAQIACDFILNGAKSKGPGTKKQILKTQTA